METAQLQVKRYNAESVYSAGILSLFRLMASDFMKSRELIWRLFLRDFTSRHKQSLLGWAWIVLMPLMTMGTFLLLNMSGIIQIGDIDVPYPIFGLLSYSIWNIFSQGLSMATTSVTGAGGLVQKINFSKDTLVFASLGQVIIDFLIRMVLTMAVFFLYGQFMRPSFFLFPVLLFPLMLLTLGIGMVSSLLQTITKDVVNFVNLGTSFLLLLMPIMYATPQSGILWNINRYNPLFYLLLTPRDLMLYGVVTGVVGFLLSSLLAISVFLVGWIFFYVSQTKLAERL